MIIFIKAYYKHWTIFKFDNVQERFLSFFLSLSLSLSLSVSSELI